MTRCHAEETVQPPTRQSIRHSSKEETIDVRKNDMMLFAEEERCGKFKFFFGVKNDES